VVASKESTKQMRLLSGWKLECLEQGAETRGPEEQQLCEGECSARRAGPGASSDERKRQRQRMEVGSEET
jgi:hypothetical protein